MMGQDNGNTELALFGNNQSAIISDCGKYRYWLSRTWDNSKPSVLWIMLNPSTADANKDDATIRRCIGFAKQWDYGGICVANLFAFRSTDKNVLMKVSEPVGEKNVWYINNLYRKNMLIVLGYGDPPPGTYSPVLQSFQHEQVYCLRITKKGNPGHPLYIPKNQELIEYRI